MSPEERSQGGGEVVAALERNKRVWLWSVGRKKDNISPGHIAHCGKENAIQQYV